MNTLFDKIWDAHVVTTVEDGPTQLYIDRLYCHEVTSPQAFAGLRERGIKVLRPEKVFCMPDHNTPTHDQDKPIEDPVSKTQVDTLTKNAKDFGLTHFGMMHPKNGIIHVVGPERGLTLPGMTIVCGDSHTSTHGAMGAIAFGIGTSEERWYWHHSVFCSRVQKRCVSRWMENRVKELLPKTLHFI